MKLVDLKSLRGFLPTDWHLAKMAFKTSIPPIVLMCAMQFDIWIDYFGVQSYLPAISALSVMAFFPQGILIQFNIRLIIGICLSYSWLLLAGWSALQARKHTTRSSSQEFQAGYNSSAEVVLAIFLSFGMWLAFTIKSAFSGWTTQTALSSILCVAILPSLSRMLTMASVIDAATKGLVAFVGGQAVGLVSALLLFPHTCRGIVKRDAASCLDALSAIMKAHAKCVGEVVAGLALSGPQSNTESSAAQLEAAVQTLANKIAKITGYVEHAARELSWGVYSQENLEKMSSLLVHLIPATSGFCLISDMILRSTTSYDISRQIGEITDATTGSESSSQQQTWHRQKLDMQMLLSQLNEAIVGGIEHARLRLRGRKKNSLFGWLVKDKAANEGLSTPSTERGGAHFIESYRHLFEPGHHVNDARKTALKHFIHHRPYAAGGLEQSTSQPSKEKIEYFILLHSHTVVSVLGCELLELLIHLDTYNADKKRIFMPNLLSGTYWAKASRSVLGIDKGSTSTAADDADAEFDTMLRKKKNPDHLPATTTVEKIGEHVRRLSLILRTEHAAYGLRGAFAIMSIAILSFLHDSQKFYFEQQIYWALFAILFSMGRTSGSSTFLLLGRLGGTLASMMASYIIWYATGQHTAGILVLLWLWFLVISYFMVKIPAFLSTWLVALIAAIVMIGIPLQTRKLGAEAVRKAGNVVYPPYIIFPYKLAVVGLGVLTGYFWTIFPFPISEHAELRVHTARLMYELSRLYMYIRQAAYGRLQQHKPTETRKDASQRLQVAMRRTFIRYRSRANRAKTAYRFLDWDFTLGGRFPQASYREILSILERSGSYMALIGYLSNTPKSSHIAASCWADPDDVVTAMDATVAAVPYGIASRLIMLHSVLGEARPLPPGLRQLSLEHLFESSRKSDDVNDKQFSMAALIHNVNWFFVYDMNRLTELVKDLVGELHFDFAY